MKRLIPLLLLLLALSTSSLAADKWTLARSPNFVLVGNAAETQIYAIANELELFRSAYSRLFPLKASSTQTTIVVFKDDADLRQHAPIRDGKPVTAPAYFLRVEDASYIVMTGRLADTGVVYHEYVHALMFDSAGGLPLCFAEGFAEYYRSFRVLPDSRKFQVGLPIRAHATRLSAQFIPLEKLFAISQDSPEYNERDRQGVFYAESWALTHYLIHGEAGKYQARIPDLIVALRSGKAPAQAIADVLQISAARLEEQLRAYALKPDAMPAMEYVIPTALDTAAGMTGRALSEAEIGYYRGDLLMGAQRTDAEGYFRAALLLDPNLGVAQTALGRLLHLQGKRVEALPFLKKGVQLNPANHLAHYYYADAVWSQALSSSLRPTAADRELALTETLKAIELAPQFVNATMLAARINLSANENIAATRALVQNARQLFPARSDLALIAAFVLTRTADRESVPQMLRDIIAETSATSSIRREAERLLETLQLEATSRKATLGNAAAAAATANGVITGLQCANGWALSLSSSSGETRVFRSSNPSAVRFAVFAPGIRPPTCGAAIPTAGIHAIVTYRPVNSPESAGEPLLIELFSN
jgi:tetratricopeptide (TPR) repeat protein